MGWKNVESIEPGDVFKFDGVWWKVPSGSGSVTQGEFGPVVDVVEKDYPEETNSFMFDDSDEVWVED